MIPILHLIVGLGTGGAETALYRLISRIEGYGFQNAVIAMTDIIGPLGEELRSLGVPVYSLKMRRKVPDLRGICRLLPIVRKEKPIVLHTWMYHANLLGSVIWPLVGRPSLVWGIRHTLMDYADYSLATAATIRLGASLSWLPKLILVNSNEALRAHAMAGYAVERMQVIPNGIDTVEFRPDPLARSCLREELGIDQGKLLIGLVARYHAFKDHATFITAAALLADKRSHVVFVLAGRGVNDQNRELVDMIDRYSLRDRVFLLDEREDVPRIMAALDIATSSSYLESFPNVVAEAMACGVPCVVTDVGESSGIIGETGRVVRRRDPQALACAWMELIDMGANRRRILGQRARARIETHYSLDSVVREYWAAYESLARPTRLSGCG